MQPGNLNLFYHPKDRLRLTVGDEKSYPTVKPVWASPLSQPGRYLALLDGKGDEITTIPDPAALAPACLDVVKEELSRRYLTAEVLRVDHAKSEFGATYWHVQTSRGEREFVTQSLQENAQWLSPTHLMLIDVDGNRFEIVDTERLDLRSREIVEAIL